MLSVYRLGGLGAAGPGPGVPLGVLRVRRLQEAAEHGRGVRAARQSGAVQTTLPGGRGGRGHQQ